MHKSILQHIINSKKEGKKLLAVLIDPEKVNILQLPSFLEKVNLSAATHIFVGGSTDKNNTTASVIKAIKLVIKLPILLFPGDYTQLTDEADGLLFLTLISGRNPEYLIEQHVKAVPVLRKLDLEIIPTGYILIDGAKETAVQRVSNTQPIKQQNIDLIKNTALAGEFSGKKMIYLEAGSGAIEVVSPTIIKSVKSELKIPLIVGGGIRSKQQLENAYNAGADLVVIGTAFEENNQLLDNF